MGIDKKGSKGGNYVDGFLQLFEWNAKSRKKLFSTKSDLPEKLKQKKRFDGTLPTTRLQMMDEDEVSAGSIVKGSNDYSCASSLTDEDMYGSKCPGVVARLMGLDSLPKPNTSDPYSTPVFDCQSLPDSCYKTGNLEYSRDPQVMQEKYRKVGQTPIKKFQTEILPPRSAKLIPVTHHKLLSPIKSANFVTSKDAGEIMEAAARIIETGRPASRKTKLSSAGSSSGPLKVKDSEEKVQSARKPKKTSEESSRNKSGKGGSSVDAKQVKIFQDSEESSSGVKSKGKSISLALQAKANVQKREALHSNSSRMFEKSEFSPNMSLTSQSGAQKSTARKPPTQNSSKVLRQNNQKQNSSNDRGKLPLKSNLQVEKLEKGDLSSTRRHNSSTLAGKYKDDKTRLSCSSSKRSRKKRSVVGNYQFENNQNIRMDKNGKVVQSSATTDTQSSRDKDSGKKGSDVISFTFTTPMGYSEIGENCKILPVDSPRKRITRNSDSMAASKLSLLGHSVQGGNTLSTFLEEQLKELAHQVEFSQQKPGVVSLVSSNMVEERNMKDGIYSINPALNFQRDAKGSITDRTFQNLEEDKSMRGRSISKDTTFLTYRLPSPVSILEHSSYAESCNSSDSAESNYSIGGVNKYSLQFQDNFSNNLPALLSEQDAELSDSASSSSSSSTVICWELKYVMKILSTIDQMFNDYAMGRAGKIIGSYLFDQLESCKQYFNGYGPIARMGRRLIFDCVDECLDRRCRKYAVGGCKLWDKGVRVVKEKDRLAEDVHKEISDWSAMGDFMVDELVDSDMSCSAFGRWLDYDIEGFEIGMKIESRILNSLIDEVVGDILLL